MIKNVKGDGETPDQAKMAHNLLYSGGKIYSYFYKYAQYKYLIYCVAYTFSIINIVSHNNIREKNKN